MSCIQSGNTRCTKCCEAIAVPLKMYIKYTSGKITIPDQDLMFGATGVWQKISKRVAKKINPHMVSLLEKYSMAHEKAFFRCTAYKKGEGCTIRGTDRHPITCRVYEGDILYSPTCETDINIIARSGG